MKKLLIISPHFPPLNAPDMQRIRMSLPFYRRSGWEPIVLCIGDAWQDGVREPELEQTIPADVRVLRVPALSPRWTKYVGLRNAGLRCWFPFLVAGTRLLRREKIDLVFFSNTQFVTFTLGRIWRALFGTPYVFDMQDPWRTDYYERRGSRPPPGGWKYQLARFMAWMLEGWSFRHVAGLMSVSPDYLVDLHARYPSLTCRPAEVIGFGGSPSDLVQAAAQPLAHSLYQRAHGEIHLLYTGASGPVMPHSLAVLFEGLRRYREKWPERGRRLHFHFVGTSYVAPGAGRPTVLPVAAGCGVGDQVEEIPHRIGHLEALRWQQQADALLLPGSSDLAYSPSKIYPYFLTGRPILGIVFRDSVMERLLDELNCAHLARFSDREPKDQAYATIAAFFDQAIVGFPPGSLPERNEALFRREYVAETLTRRQCALFDRATAPADIGAAVATEAAV